MEAIRSAINMSENADNLANNELLTKAYVNTAALLRIKIGRLSYPFMVCIVSLNYYNYCNLSLVRLGHDQISRNSRGYLLEGVFKKR